MGPIEIILIVGICIVVLGLLARYIYKKIKKIPTSSCDCCKPKINGKKLVDEYRKKYKKQ